MIVCWCLVLFVFVCVCMWYAFVLVFVAFRLLVFVRACALFHVLFVCVALFVLVCLFAFVCMRCGVFVFVCLCDRLMSSVWVYLNRVVFVVVRASVLLSAFVRDRLFVAVVFVRVTCCVLLYVLCIVVCVALLPFVVVCVYGRLCVLFVVCLLLCVVFVCGCVCVCLSVS